MTRALPLLALFSLGAVPAGAQDPSESRDEPGWVLTFEGGEDVFDLPDLEGRGIGLLSVGPSVQITGVAAGGRLLVQIDTDGELEETKYRPGHFSVTWRESDYSCVATEDLALTITGLDPAAGSVSGTLRCHPPQVTPGSTFDVSVTGSFLESM